MLSNRIAPDKGLDSAVTGQCRSCPDDNDFNTGRCGGCIRSVFINCHCFRAFTPRGILCRFKFNLSCAGFGVRARGTGCSRNGARFGIGIAGVNSIPNERAIRFCISTPGNGLKGTGGSLITFRGARLLSPNSYRAFMAIVSGSDFTSCSSSNGTKRGDYCMLRDKVCSFCMNGDMQGYRGTCDFALRDAIMATRLSRIVTIDRGHTFRHFTTIYSNSGVTLSGRGIPIHAIDLGGQVLSSLPSKGRVDNSGNCGLSSMGTNGMGLRSFATRLSLSRLRTVSQNRKPVGDSLKTGNGTNTFNNILGSLERGKVPPVVAASNPSKVELLSTYSLVPYNATVTYS